jgi:hypothetical protein
MGEYRNQSPLWRPTTKNGISRKDYRLDPRPRMKNSMRHAERVCYSHEYIGKKG